MKRLRVLLVLVALLAAGCGTEPAQGGEVSFAERLELLPRSLMDGAAGPVVIQMADLARAADIAGVAPPADAAGAGDYLTALTGPPVAALLPSSIQQPGQVTEFEAELGWSVLDVRWYVEYATAPETLTVFGGDIDREQLTAAAGEGQDGRWRVGDGEDLTVRLDQRTAARPLGRPLTMALDAGRLFVSPSGAAVAAATTDGPTLADVAELQSLAAAMDKEAAYSAVLTMGEDTQAEQTPGGGLQPFTAIAAGVTHDGEPAIVFAYTHADAATAEANATAVRAMVEQGRSYRTDAPWSDSLAVEEIRVDGTTVIARLALRNANPLIGYQILMNRDSLAVAG